MDIDALAELVQRLPDAVVVLDSMAVIEWANPAAERIFDRSNDDVIGHSGTDLVHPDDLPVVLVGLATLGERPVGETVEVRVLAADGWRLVELMACTLPDDRILLSLRDLTARRRFEVAHSEEARFRSLVHNAGTVTMLVTPDGIVESISGAMTRLTGLDPADIEDQPLTAILASEPDRARFLEALAQVAPGMMSTTVVDIITQDHRDPVPMEITIVDLRDDPTVNGYVISAHEVIERIAVENELRHALSLLHATLDSTADGILVVDAKNSITSFNQQFVDMWRIPDDIAAARDDDAALAFVTDQLADPTAFVTKVQELYAHPEEDSYDLLTFKDGRVFERVSHPQRVDGSVVGRVWSFRDLTDRKHLEDELVYRAFHDQLTGLANKARFCDRLEHVVDRSRRLSTGFSVLFLDLDNFKMVNDSLGHLAGDELLVAAAEILTGCLRSPDTAARLGGDEFAVLIEDTVGPDAAITLAARITEAFRQPFRIADREIFATVSIGIAFGDRSTTTDAILRDADLAMYVAKGKGKNRFEVFEESQHVAAIVRVEFESDLRRAIEQDEFQLFYQPIVDTTTGYVVATEALIRWHHPTRGLLAPDHFIPLAEETGLMESIGRSLLERACEQTHAWQVAGARDLAISVNISPSQLTNATVVGDVAEVVSRFGIAPSSLILEITETAMLRDTDTARRNLLALKEIGVLLALDDFGTGYSSLTYLENFPIDIVKIDKSFVASVELHERAQSLTPAIVRLAQSLGLRTVAEGVETPRQLQRLRTLGCDLVQGFYLSHPRPAAELDPKVLARMTRLPAADEVTGSLSAAS